MGISNELDTTGLLVVNSAGRHFLVLEDDSAAEIRVARLNHHPDADTFTPVSLEASEMVSRESLVIVGRQERAEHARRVLEVIRPVERRIGHRVWNTETREIHRLAVPPLQMGSYSVAHVVTRDDLHTLREVRDYRNVYAPYFDGTEPVEITVSAAQAIASAVALKMNDEARLIETLRCERDEAKAHIERINDRLIEEAEERGWCSEYDDFARELDLRPRRKEYLVRTVVTTEIDVRVEASSPERAVEEVNNMDSGTIEDHLRDHLSHSYPDSWEVYEHAVRLAD